ncbi:TnsA endonuclease N-terminal domain-containing protein [bacterium]|nr:TnsA endonuclease N-terminal domain-containing protein [bacterium]
MPHSIQFESHTVELALIYEFEFDPDVIEYWDQPPSFYLDYRDESGRRYRHLYTPDFFVIREAGAGWVKAKTEKSLLKFTERFPDRYKKENGQWVSPAGARYASEFGLSFQVVSSEAINYVLLRNIQLLEPYYCRSQRQDSPGQEKIVQILNRQGFMNLSKLLEETAVTIEDVYWLISDNAIFADLNQAFLGEINRVTVYRDPETAAFHEKLKVKVHCSESVLPLEAIRTGMTVNWDSRVCKILVAGHSIALVQFDDGNPESISMKIIEEQVRAGKIRAVQQECTSSSELNALFATISESQRIEAVRRLKIIEPVLRGESTGELPVSRRTLRNWISKYYLAEKNCGNGFYGIIPKANKGNTEDRLAAVQSENGELIDVRKILNDCIEQKYLNERQKRSSVVYAELVRECRKNGVTPPSRKAFRRGLRRFSTEQVERARKGPKAANQYEQFYYTLDDSVPVHGDRPWQIAHLDHTELDIELVDSETRKAIGRPWLTILIDGYSRKIFAFHISFDKPSYRSYLEVVRECVRAWNRLPEGLDRVFSGQAAGWYFSPFALILYRPWL